MSSPVFLSLEEGAAPRPSPLAAIVPPVAVLGLMTYFGVVLAGGDDPLVLYQVGVLVGLLAYLLTFANIILGIAILIAGIGLSPEFTLGGIPNLRLEDFVIPAIAAAWLTRSIRNRESSSPCRLRGPLVAFLGSMLISLLLGIPSGSTEIQIAILTTGKFVEYGLILLLVAHNVRTEREIRALAVFSVLIALLSIPLGTSTGAAGAFPPRAQGPLGETATIFGGYLLLNLFLALGWYLHATGPWPRAAAAAGSLLLGTAVLLTYSRTTYAALALGMALFAVLKQRRLLVMFLVLLTAFPLLAPESIWRRAATISTVVTEEATPSWVARIEAWKVALAQWSARAPLTGFGPGATPMGNIDNEYVFRLYETGLLGMAAFLWLIRRLIRISNALHDSLPSPGFNKGFAAGYMMGFLGMLVHAIGATSFTAIRPMEQFMLLSGLMIALANLVPSPGPEESPGMPEEQAEPAAAVR